MVIAATMGTLDWVALAAICLALGAAVLLVAVEEAVSRMNIPRAEAMAEHEPKGAASLVRILSKPVVNSIRLLVLMVQLAETTLVAMLAVRLLPTALTVVVVVLNVAVVYVVAEAVPRTLGIQKTDRIAISAARPVEAITSFTPIRLLARGLIWLTNIVVPGEGLGTGPFDSTQDLLAMVDTAVKESVMEPQEQRLIRSVIEFGDTVVREVMVPRTDMRTVSRAVSVEQSLGYASDAGFSRLPVVGDNRDDVVGLVYVKDLILAELDGQPDQQVGALMRSAEFVPETKKVNELLQEMQQAKFHMAMVVDEYGGIAGLVTMEDLIEELVGEIVDEYDNEEPQFDRVGGHLRLAGRMSIDEANDLAGLDLPEGDWDTVAGLMFDRFGRVPELGETCEVNGYQLQVNRLQGRRITRVVVLPIPTSDDPEQPETDKPDQSAHGKSPARTNK